MPEETLGPRQDRQIFTKEEVKEGSTGSVAIRASTIPSADFCMAVRKDFSFLSSAPTEHHPDLPR
jgi:hypothetical protein